MTYKETLDWMYVQLPMYQRQGDSAYKIDLTNTLQLASYLGNPQTKFKSIHVAGTNGKGSTSHMLASVLQEVGYKVGLYTSPHLKDFRERIRINGKKVSEQYVVDFIKKYRSYFEENHLSFFEMTVGMAFHYFAEVKVDIAVIEVGLGGRLDSTNIIMPEISVITNIGIDHTRFLGETISEIASEKAGIIKENTPVVIGRATSVTEKVFLEKANHCNADLFFADHYEGNLYPSDLKGNYQEENIRTALQTISILQGQGWEIDELSIQHGLAKVATNTGLLGRWQVIQKNPKVICDTAHNADGLKAVMKQLSEEMYDQLHIILGMVDDKDLDTILPFFPTHARYYFVKPNIARGLNENELRENALKFTLKGKCYTSVAEAYETALQQATNQDVIYIGGSTFVVAEII